MDLPACRGCGKPLMPVKGCPWHPDPKCDPRPGWSMSDEQLAELEARYWPTATPAPTTQEAQSQ